MDAKWHRDYYARTKETRIELKRADQKRQRTRNRLFIFEYLASHACVDCGEKDPIVLDFDHLHSKIKDVSDMSSSGWSIRKIQEEIDKCEVRCSNCHRRITHKRRLGVA